MANVKKHVNYSNEQRNPDKVIELEEGFGGDDGAKETEMKQ